jgi:endogenous inhibitor of DNA gyrase (YacG/DUF329 family)
MNCKHCGAALDEETTILFCSELCKIDYNKHQLDKRALHKNVHPDWTGKMINYSNRTGSGYCIK